MQTRRAHPFFNLIQGTATLPSILPAREIFREFFLLLSNLASGCCQRVKKSRFISTLNEPYTNNIDPHHKLSFVIIAAQIIWFGLGLTLFYDTAESILHWPHLLVVSLSSALMIVTAWFGMRAMMLLSLVTLPGILSLVYFSIAHAVPGDNPLALWTQMISSKSVEYLSGMFIVLGSCVSSIHPEVGSKKKLSRITLLAILGFVVGNGLVFFSGIHSALAAGETNFSMILSQQGPTVLGLCLLGLSARTAKNDSFSGCGRVVAQLTRIPLRLVVIIVGTGCAVFSDWYSQYMVGRLQYASMLVPPLALLLMGKFFFRHVSKI